MVIWSIKRNFVQKGSVKMGIISSKSSGVSAKTPEKKSVAATIEQSPTSSTSSPSPKKHQFLDPKTPAVPQTPLTQTIANHLNKISADDFNQNAAIKTPSYLLRKKILYDLGYTYSIKDTDPRSPSHSIPRTPLSLAEKPSAESETETTSFQYNSTLEDSCRDFNAKLDDITMEEEAEIDAQHTSTENNEQKNESTPECNQQPELSEQKTPNTDSGITSEIKSQIERDVGAKLHENKDENDSAENDEQIDFAEDKIMPLESMYSTPIAKKSGRAGRIPLSQLNRRAVSTEVTPVNNSEPLSIEKYKKDLSFNSFDENRSSARKSKIPVFKK